MNLLQNANAVANGTFYPIEDQIGYVWASGQTTAGAGAVQVRIDASEDGVTPLATPLGTITLTLGTTASADGFAVMAAYKFLRAVVVSISGTGAAVSAGTRNKR